MPAKDTYANMAVITVTEPAANTLTFSKLETGINLGSNIAWLINRIEYFLPPIDYSVFNTVLDAFDCGLAQSNKFSTINVNDASIIDIVHLRKNGGTATVDGVVFQMLPLVKDFSTLPGGGLIVVPNPIYGFSVGCGLAAATTTKLKVYYTQMEIKDADFYELFQSRIMLT
jgi:hypothetical protein